MRKFCVLFVFVFVLTLCGCGNSDKTQKVVAPPMANKIIQVEYFGSQVVSPDLDGFAIQGIRNAKFKYGVYSDKDYLFYDKGPEVFSCLFEGRTIEFRGIKIENIPQDQILEIDLDNNPLPVYEIPDDKMIVKVSGNPDSVYYSSFVAGQDRELPVRFEIDQLKITGYGDCCLFSNFSIQPMEINVKGECELKEGTQHNIDEIYDGEKIIENAFSESYQAYVAMNHSLPVDLSNTISSADYDTSFKEKATLYTDFSFQFPKNILDEIKNLIEGDDGLEGLKGIPAIFSLGNVSVSGSGSITVVGGSGGDGQDAGFNFGFARGGNGGNSAPAVVAYRFCSGVKKSVFQSGLPGKGGVNKMNSDKTGYDGRKASDLDVRFAYYSFQ